MDRQSITLEIRRLIKDTSTDTALQRWSDAILQSRENYIQEEMMAAAEALEARATDTDIVSGTSEYSLPSTILSIKQVLLMDSASKYDPLKSISEQELNRLDPSWRDVTGTPTHYYLSRGKIGLYPKPDYSRTSGLRLDGILKAADMSSDTDVPFNSDYRFYFAHLGLCYGVARLCFMDDGKWTDATAMNVLYMDSIKGMKRVATSENFDMRVINVYEQARAGVRRTR